jgi:hypothetical protein
MIHRMFGTLVAAGLANLGTYAAYLGSELRPAAHERRRHPTNVGTVAIQPDALGHFADVALAQAGVGAMLALLGATHTRLDARSILLMSHLELLSFQSGRANGNQAFLSFKQRAYRPATHKN